MKLNVLLRTSEYRGDHGADVAIAYEVRPGETVEQLAMRLFNAPSGSYRNPEKEWIELRLIAGDSAGKE